MNIICKICDKYFSSKAGLRNHLHSKFHDNISIKEYYDMFYKVINEDKCIICGKQTQYNNYRYMKYCSKKCSSNDIKRRNKENHADFSTVNVNTEFGIIHVKKCLIKKHGVEVATEKEIDRIKKFLLTLSKRDWNSNFSKEEDMLYEYLISIFGRNEIERQKKIHFWSIDFYVKSIDLYVEYNGSFWHGKKYNAEEIKRKINNNSKIYKSILNRIISDKNKITYFANKNLDILFVEDLDFKKYFENIIENRKNCWNGEIPNQQPSIQWRKELNDGSETREMSTNNNFLHEHPTTNKIVDDIVRTT